MYNAPTDAELIFWIIAAVLAFAFMFIITPLANNYIANKDARRMLRQDDYIEYHDDMEDWG